MLNQASLSSVEPNYGFEQGGSAQRYRWIGSECVRVRSESYRRWNRLSSYGKLSYDYAASKDRSWAEMPASEIPPSDAAPAIRFLEIRGEETQGHRGRGCLPYGALGGWSDGKHEGSQPGQSVGIRAPKTTSMHLSVQPGVMFYLRRWWTQVLILRRNARRAGRMKRLSVRIRPAE